MADRLDDADLGASLRRVVNRAIDEAARLGASAVEAEHLLLAISAGSDVASGVLADFGLDHAGVESALRSEREHALRAAGIEPVSDERLRATRRSRPGWGASVREALLRVGDRAHRDRGRAERKRLVVADALLGILRADLGTVPRALAYAGVDRQALINRLESL